MKTPTLQEIHLISGEDRMFALMTFDKKCKVIELEGERPVGQIAVPAGMSFMTPFPGPEGTRGFALGSRQGKMHVVVPPKKGVSMQIPEAGTGPGKHGYLDQAIAIQDRAMVIGYDDQLYAWTGKEWVDESGPFLAVAGPRRDPSVPSRGLASIVEVEGDPVLIQSDRTWKVYRRVQGQWGLLADLPMRANSLAYDPETKTLYASGMRVWSISAQGAVTELGKPEEEAWGSAVFRGRLCLSDLRKVTVFEQGTFAAAAGAGDETKRNHALHASARGLYLARASSLDVFDGQHWRSLPTGALWM